MYVGLHVVDSDALDEALDEDVAGRLSSEEVDVVEDHLVRVPDDASQLVTGWSGKMFLYCHLRLDDDAI